MGSLKGLLLSLKATFWGRVTLLLGGAGLLSLLILLFVPWQIGPDGAWYFSWDLWGDYRDFAGYAYTGYLKGRFYWGLLCSLGLLGLAAGVFFQLRDGRTAGLVEKFMQSLGRPSPSGRALQTALGLTVVLLATFLMRTGATLTGWTLFLTRNSDDLVLSPAGYLLFGLGLALISMTGWELYRRLELNHPQGNLAVGLGTLAVVGLALLPLMTLVTLEIETVGDQLITVDPSKRCYHESDLEALQGEVFGELGHAYDGLALGESLLRWGFWLTLLGSLAYAAHPLLPAGGTPGRLTRAAPGMAVVGGGLAILGILKLWLSLNDLEKAYELSFMFFAEDNVNPINASASLSYLISPLILIAVLLAGAGGYYLRENWHATLAPLLFGQSPDDGAGAADEDSGVLDAEAVPTEK